MEADFSFHFEGLRCWVSCPSTVMERQPTKSFKSSGEQSTEGETPVHLLIGVINLNATEVEEETMMKKNWTSQQSSEPSRGMFSRKMRPQLKLICVSSWDQQQRLCYLSTNNSGWLETPCS
jgi:hypothetical protein